MSNEFSINMGQSIQMPPEGTIVTIRIAGATPKRGKIGDKKDVGHVYGSFFGDVVAPSEYMGNQVRKNVMIAPVLKAIEAKNPKKSLKENQLTFAQWSQTWPSQARALFEKMVGIDVFADLLAATGGKFTGETLKGLKGALFEAPIVYNKYQDRITLEFGEPVGLVNPEDIDIDLSGAGIDFGEEVFADAGMETDVF